MRSLESRVVGKMEASKELSSILQQIAREGYKIDDVMVAAVLAQYGRDKGEVMRRHEDRVGTSASEAERQQAHREMMTDDAGTVTRLQEYFVPMDKNQNQSLRSIVHEMLQSLPQKNRK